MARILLYPLSNLEPYVFIKASDKDEFIYCIPERSEDGIRWRIKDTDIILSSSAIWYYDSAEDRERSSFYIHTGEGASLHVSGILRGREEYFSYIEKRLQEMEED